VSEVVGTGYRRWDQVRRLSEWYCTTECGRVVPWKTLLENLEMFFFSLHSLSLCSSTEAEEEEEPGDEENEAETPEEEENEAETPEDLVLFVKRCWKMATCDLETKLVSVCVNRVFFSNQNAVVFFFFFFF